MIFKRAIHLFLQREHAQIIYLSLLIIILTNHTENLARWSLWFSFRTVSVQWTKFRQAV